MILILVGAHGVGKTTVGSHLSRRLNLPFHAELGRSLAEDPAWRPSGQTADEEAERFDEELFRRECARDLAWGSMPRVIETWHPGNLAYAERRSPEVVRRWGPDLHPHCARSDAVVQPLVAPVATLAARQSEPGDLRFFVQVGHAALRWATTLGLPCLAPLDTSQQTPIALAEIIATRLTRLSPPLLLRSTPCASS